MFVVIPQSLCIRRILRRILSGFAIRLLQCFFQNSDPRLQGRQIFSVIQHGYCLEIILSHKESLLCLPCFQQSRKNILILCSTKDQCSILPDLRILMFQKVRQQGEISAQKIHEVSPQRLIGYVLTDLNQVLPDIPVLPDHFQHLFQSCHNSPLSEREGGLRLPRICPVIILQPSLPSSSALPTDPDQKSPAVPPSQSSGCPDIF